MGTKAKSVTKVLSVFLSVLMALSCFYVALPGLAPAALAAESQATVDDWQALANAFLAAYNGGYMSVDHWSGVGAASGTVTVTDDTDNGYVFNIVKALSVILKADGTKDGTNHNAKLRAHIKDKLASLTCNSGAGLNPFQEEFLDTLLDVGAADDGGYGEFTQENQWNGSAAAAANLLAKTMTIVATRSDVAAVLTDYANVNDIGSQLKTTITITIKAEAQECESDNGSETGRYYANTEVTVEEPKTDLDTASSHLADLKAYYNYVNSDAFKTGYEAWLAGAKDIKIVYRWEKAKIEGIVKNMLTDALWAKASLANTVYIEKYIGIEDMNLQREFADHAEKALALLPYRGYVEWIKDGLPYGEYKGAASKNRDDYTATDLTAMQAVIAQAQAFKEEIDSASEEIKTALHDTFDYQGTEFDTFIAEMQAKVNNLNLQEVATISKFLLSNNAAANYAISNTTSRFFGLNTQVGQTYRKTSDKDVDQDKTYYIDTTVIHYGLTEDTTIDPDKTYYTKDGDVYTAVAAPTEEDLASYYEVTQIETIYKKTTDASLVSGKTYYTKSGDVYTAVQYPQAEDLADYYEVEYKAVEAPKKSELGSYYELVTTYSGLKGIGNSEYLASNYEHFEKTSDTSVVSGKTYYVYAEVSQKYNKVLSPNTADIATYYEMVNDCPITDDDLDNLCSFFTIALQIIDDAEHDGVNLDDYLTSDQITNIRNSSTALNNERISRGHVTEAFLQDYSYFLNKMSGNPAAGLSSAQIIADATYGEEQLTALRNNYSWFASNSRYPLVREYLDSLYVEAYDRVVAAYNRLVADYNINTSLGINNLYLVKADLANWNDDLVNFVNNNASKIKTLKGISSLAFNLTTVNNIRTAANKTLSNVWSAITSSKTTYSNILRNTYADDFARTTANDNRFWARFSYNAAPTYGKYATVSDTITKLDTFLANENFTKLLGVDEQGKGITTLTGYIQDVLVEELFSDKIVNAIVSALFPMLCKLLDETLLTKLEEFNGKDLHDGAPNGLGLSDIDGTLYIWYDGNNGTIPLPELAYYLGFSIYPYTFGMHLANRGYTAIGNALKTGDMRHWSKFNNADGDVELTFDWGLDNSSKQIDQRYAKFCTVLGDIFAAAEPLLRTLLGPDQYYKYIEYDDSVTTYQQFNHVNVAKARVTDVEGHVLTWVSLGSASVDELDAKIWIDPLNLYRTLWVPIMEALGIGVAGGIVPNYNFSTYDVTSGANAARMVKALFEPIYQLLLKVTAAPIQNVLKILPNLAYHILNIDSSLGNLLNRNIHIRLKLEGGDIYDASGLLTVASWDWVTSLILNIFSDKLDFSFDVALSEFLTVAKLEEMLEMDMHDLNSLLRGVFAKIIKDENAVIEIPAINTGRLATMYTTASAVSSQAYNADGTARGTVNYISGNPETIFYGLFDYIFRSANQKGAIMGLISTISQVSGSELALPDIVFTLIENIDSAPQAFVALIEFLNMEKTNYKLADYEWYQANQATTPVNAANFVYTKYSNDWTLEKAKYLYGNIDDIVNSVVNIIDKKALAEYNGDANVWLEKLVNSMFDNEGIMNLVKGLTGIGNALAGSPSIAKIIKQQITGVSASDGEVNLFDWYNKWGYLYDDYRVPADAAEDEILAYNQINKQTYVYKLVAKKDHAGNEYTIVPGNTNTHTWKIERAYPVAPGETVPWQINGQNIYHTAIAPYSQYNSLFSKIRMATPSAEELYNEGMTNEDVFYVWEVNKGGSWQRLVKGADNSRELFSAMLAELVKPLSPLFSFILSGKNLRLFGNTDSTAVVIKGYASYNSAVLPLMEALAINDIEDSNGNTEPMKTQAEFDSYIASNGSGAGFEYLINKLFGALDDLLRDDRERNPDGTFVTDENGVVVGKGAFQKVVDVLPRIFYYLQSNGLNTMIKNLPMFVWTIVDTLRPIANIKVDEYIHLALTRLLDLTYDANNAAFKTGALANAVFDMIGMEAPAYSAVAAGRDLSKVQAIFNFSIKNLRLPAIFALVKGITNINVDPLTYAFEGMCAGNIVKLDPVGTANSAVGVTAYRNTSNVFDTYTIKYAGWDVITVTIAALLDILTYEHNAGYIDELIGTVRERTPGMQALLSDKTTATGLFDALQLVFEDTAADQNFLRPNWDYIFEGRVIPSEVAGNTYPWGEIWQDVVPNETSGDPHGSSAYDVKFKGYVEHPALDLHALHLESMNNLKYLTDWQPETADATAELLDGLLEYVFGLVDINELLNLPEDQQVDVSNLSEVAKVLLDEYVFTNDILVTIVNFIAQIYKYLDKSLRNTIDTLIGVRMNDWDTLGIVEYNYPIKEDADGNKLIDEETGEYVRDTEAEQEWQANLNHEWFVEGSAGYVHDEETFLNALMELIKPAGDLIAFIFLGQDYRLFNTVGTTIQSATGDDAIVLNSANAYGVGLVPIFEALNVDMRDYPASKYLLKDEHGNPVLDANGNPNYDTDQFVLDVFAMIEQLVYDILDGPIVRDENGNYVTDSTGKYVREGGPVRWLIDVLPNLIYFINADGLTTSIKNIFGSVYYVLNAVSKVVDFDIDISQFFGGNAQIADMIESNFRDLDLSTRGIFNIIYNVTSAKDEDGNILPGFYLSEALETYIKQLYIGEVEAYWSANGYRSFRMKYSSAEDAGDMITVALSLVLELLTDSGKFVDANNHGNYTEYNNAETLDRLIFGGKAMEGLVGEIVNAIRNPERLVPTDINWHYFDETFDLAAHTDEETDEVLEVPAYAFQYLNYSTAWKYANAAAAEDAFEHLVLEAVKMLVPDEITQEGIIGDILTRAKDAQSLGEIVNIDFVYSDTFLTQILDFISGFLYGEDSFLNDAMIDLIGLMLGGDLTQWNGGYRFGNAADYTKEGDETITTGVTLPYAMDGDVKVYLVGGETVAEQKATFIAAATKLLEPAKGILSWLLFGDDYTFFSSNKAGNEDQVLITLPGSNGYQEGLIYLLEAIGCKRMRYVADYTEVDGSINIDLFVNDLLTSIADRVEAICADPVYNILNLIPELIYFINAGGLQRVVTGLLSGPLGLVNKVSSLGGFISSRLGVEQDEEGVISDDDYVVLNAVLNVVLKKAFEGKDIPEDFSFRLEDINLKFIFEIVEVLTGFEITDVIGSNLDKFKIGTLESYASKAGTIAYRMKFSDKITAVSTKDHFADFITILLSAVIDLVEYIPNARKLAQMLNVDEELIVSVVTFLREGFDTTVQDIDWFYFDENYTIYDADGKLKDPKPAINANTLVNIPEKTINYLSYASDWTKDTADYLYAHMGDILMAVLRMAGLAEEGQTVKQLVDGYVDLNALIYNNDGINKILDAIEPLAAQLPSIVNELLGIVLDVDLSAYGSTIERPAEGEIHDRATFAAKLTEVLLPLAPILDWLLFGKSLQYFDKKANGTGPLEILINLPGANGYAYGLVPLLEALGVVLPSVDEDDTTATVLLPLISNVLARVETILDNPVDEVLNTLPNLIYFINADGLSAVLHNLLAGPIALIEQIGGFVIDQVAPSEDDGEGSGDEPAEPAQTSYSMDINTFVMTLLKKFVPQIAEYDITIDIEHFDLLSIVKIAEQITGLKIAAVVTEDKLDNFYLPPLKYFESANGKPAFRMEGSGDMLTILANFVIEVLLYDTNPHTIDMLISNNEVDEEGNPKTQIVEQIVEILLGIRDYKSVGKELNWNYFDETVSLGEGTIPASAWVYLDYNNQWTYSKAVYLAGGLNDLIAEVFSMVKPGEDIGEFLKGLIPLKDYLNADTLNMILGYIDQYLIGEDAILDKVLLDVIGLVLGADLTEWDGSYTFEDYDAAQTYETDETYGLKYRFVVDGDKTKTVYALDNSENYNDFATGLQIVLEPASSLLAWLLMGNSYAFFVPAETGNVNEAGERQDDELIRVMGTYGYDEGLSILLEALGCKNEFSEDLKAGEPYLKKAAEYKDCADMLGTVIKVLLSRLDEILSNPVEEIIELIPELIYFINAGGLGAVVENFAGSVLNILEQVAKAGLIENIDVEKLVTDLLQGLLKGGKEDSEIDAAKLAKIEDFTFSFDGVNLQWAIDLAEIFTGLEIDEAIGRSLENFAIGEVVRYDSVSTMYDDETTGESMTYKMTFGPLTAENTEGRARNRADMITILLSLVIDVIEYKDPANNIDNVAAIEALINGEVAEGEEPTLKPGLIDAVISIITAAADDSYMDIDWFYFNEGNTADEEKYDETQVDFANLVYPNIDFPEPTINYLTYHSDWTKETADYLAENINEIIADVLKLMKKDETSLAEIINGVFDPETDLYTPDLLMKIVDAVNGLVTADNETLFKFAGMLLGADLTAYQDMNFTAENVNDKESFINALVEVLTPVSGLLDWLLFDSDLYFFHDNDYYHSEYFEMLTDGEDHTEAELEAAKKKGEDDRDLIAISGAEGYAYGLVPILEALGVKLETVDALKLYEPVDDEGNPVKKTSLDILPALLTAVFDRVEEILADPVNEVLDILPNIIYFINANGLSVSVNNLLNAVMRLLTTVNENLEAIGGIKIGDTTYTEIDLNDLVNDLLANDSVQEMLKKELTVDVFNLDLTQIFRIVEAFTGLDIIEVVTTDGGVNKLDKFYLGVMNAFRSSNGKLAFRMGYSEDASAPKAQTRKDMLTVLVNFLLEVVLYKDEAKNINNVDAILALLGETVDDDTRAMVYKIVAIITGTDPDLPFKELDWDYFKGNEAVGNGVYVPKNGFIYLAYQNDWTFNSAKLLDSELKDLVDEVIAMIPSLEASNLSELINGLVDLDELVFNADNLNKILDLVAGLIYGEDSVVGNHLAEAAGLLLGAELTGWNDVYAFEAYDAAKTYTTDSTGLRFYMNDEGKKIYGIENRTDFINGLCLIVQPADRLLGWLLLGDSYGFFVDNATGNTGAEGKTIINIPGNKGYAGLALLLEALGVKNVNDDLEEGEVALKEASAYANADDMLRTVLTALVNRVEAILANPIDEALDLINELIYFINANGLYVTVNNIASLAFYIIDAIGVDFDVDKLIGDMIRDAANNENITFALDGLNLKWAVDLAEELLGVKIHDVLSNKYAIEHLAIGIPTKYESVSGLTNAYKIRFAEYEDAQTAGASRADFLTMVLSFVIDLLRNEENQAIVEDLAGLTAGTIGDIVKVITRYGVNVDPDAIDWFYFDPEFDYEAAGDDALKALVPSINYLTYNSDWSEELATYLDDNLDELILTVLSMAKQEGTVADIIKGVFDPATQLYTAENLEKIRDMIAGLTADLQNVFYTAAKVLLDVDLGAWAGMEFDAAKIDGNRGAFADGLSTILAPIYPVVNWLLFGDDLAFFNKILLDDNNNVEDILVIEGYNGYAKGLVPLLEALGVSLPSYDYGYRAGTPIKSAEDAPEKDFLTYVILSVFDRLDEILADPVNEALELIPNLLYYINANGLAYSVNHLLGAVLNIVNKVNPVLRDLGIEIMGHDQIDVDLLLNELLRQQIPAFENVEISTKKLDLVAILEVAEAFTGMKLIDVVTKNKVDNFYLGQINAFPSTNGEVAFRMEFHDDRTDAEGAKLYTQDRHDLITVLINYILEVALYEWTEDGETHSNAQAIDKLINKENFVESVIEAVKLLGKKSLPGDYDWNYFGGTYDETANNDIIVPTTPFNNYLTYKQNDWTKSFANGLYDNLDEVVNAVMKMIGKGDTLGEMISGTGFTIYKAEYLQKLVDLIENLYTTLDSKLIDTLSLVLDVDLSYWHSLTFTDADASDPQAFRASVVEILKPVARVLDWLLFGKDYGFFVDSATGEEQLLKIAGSYGYAFALVPILDALGVDFSKIPYVKGYTCDTVVDVPVETVVDGAVTTTTVQTTFLAAVVDAILDRVDTLLANPVDEALALIPELFYFINANGLSTAVYNLLGVVVNAANTLFEKGVIDLGGAASIEDYVYTNFGIDPRKLDLAGIFAFLENFKKDDELLLKGLKLNAVFTRPGATADDPDENYLENFYFGDVAKVKDVYVSGFEDAEGYVVYNMIYDKNADGSTVNGGDLFTLLLSIVLEVLFYDDNAQPIADIINGFLPDDATPITETNIKTLVLLLKEGVAFDTDMEGINWTYFLDLTDEERAALLQQIFSGEVSEIAHLIGKPTAHYLEYDNNWNEETLKYVDENLNEIVDMIIALISKGESETLAAFLNDKLSGYLYTNELADLIFHWLGDKLSALDDVLLDTVGPLVGAEELSALKNYNATGISDKESFVDALVAEFSRLDKVLDWLLFNQPLKLFTHLDDGEPATITLNGGEGYKYGLAPILAALGIETNNLGEERSATALKTILMAVCDRIDEILANPIDEVLDLLPELIYFINTDALTVCANNLVAPVNELLKQVGANIGKEDLSLTSIILDRTGGMVDLDNLNFNLVYSILLDKLGIDIEGAIGDYLTTFYFGKLTNYKSYGNIDGARMGYSDQEYTYNFDGVDYTVTENRYSFITVLVTMLLDVVTHPVNEEALIKILEDAMGEGKGATTYATIMGLITKGVTKQKAVPYNWILTEYADTDTVLSPATGELGESIFGSIYGPLYTAEMGQYIEKYLPLFVDTWLTLLGIDDGKGGTYRSLEDLLEGLIGSSIYKTSLLQTILDALTGAINSLKDTIGEQLYKHIAAVLKSALGIDLAYWDNYTVNEIAEGDQAAFISELCRMVRPATPILKWLLVEDPANDIAILNHGYDDITADHNYSAGDDYIVLASANGYRDSIIPILEALHVDSSTILSQTEYAAAADEEDALLKNILNPLFGRVNEILADPLNEVFGMLPAIVYFVNSKGLDSAFKNLLISVYQLLEAIDPMLKDVDQLHDDEGNVTLYKLIGLDLEKMDMDAILTMVLDSLNDKVDFDLEGIVFDAVTELTVGKVVSFTSIRFNEEPNDENGNPRKDYTMEYVKDSADRVDMVTIVLRLLLKFLSTPQNVIALENILKDKLNAEGYKFLCSLLENFSKMASTKDGMDKVMYTVYYIFYAALNAGVATNNGLATFNGNYSFLNQLFATSNVGFLRQLEASFGDLLNKWTGDVVDDDEVAPKGFIKLFQAIINFFKKIIAFFQNLFA